VISAGEKIGLEHLLLELSRHPIVVPRVAQLRARAFGVTLRGERARQHKTAPCGLWLRALEQTNDFARLRVFEPEHLLGVPAENGNARPARVCGDESKVARAWKAVAVAQDNPLDELARSQVGDGRFDLGRSASGAAQAVDCLAHQRNIRTGNIRYRPCQALCFILHCCALRCRAGDARKQARCSRCNGKSRRATYQICGSQAQAAIRAGYKRLKWTEKKYRAVTLTFRSRVGV